MKKFLLVAVALFMASLSAHAHTTENALFTCEGELTKSQGNDGKDYYAIEKTWQEEGRGECDIAEGKVLRQILAVCRVGDFCTVAAKGEAGNGPSYLIQKVFEVQRQPASVVQELKQLNRH